MKKTLFILALITAVMGFSGVRTNADTESVVKIEIPASSIEKIDVKYEKDSPTATEKAIDATKDATDKTIKATKKATKKTVDATKDATDKTVKATKKATKKTVEATKEVTDKTVKATKNLKDKTVEGTKELMENLNPNKPVTVESLEQEATLKTLKNEKKELKAAYNSRIKDINAKIKATENSTTISDVQKQNQIYTLNKQKKELIAQRDNTIEKYNTKIEEQKNK